MAQKNLPISIPIFQPNTQIAQKVLEPSLSKIKVLSSITDLIQMHPKSQLKFPSPDRLLYANILQWFQKQQIALREITSKQSHNSFETIQKQFQLFSMSMDKLAELSQKYCKEKGDFIRVLMAQQSQTYKLLKNYTEERINKAFRDQLQNQLLLDKEYEQKVNELEEQVKQLSQEKDKKWKNMFMLIKDNRVMRRQRGKLLRELKQCYMKQVKLEEKTSDLMRENERYKIMMNDNYFEGRDFELWSKQLLNLIKYEKTLKKYPSKAKKILEFDLEALQISQMKSIQEKIEYIIKAIEQADQIVQFYEDLNQITIPSKLLLNNSAQTQLITHSKGINTPIKKYVNSYCQIKKSELAKQYLTIHSNCCESTVFPPTKMSSSLHRYKSTSSLKDFRSEKGLKNSKQRKQNNKEQKLECVSVFSMNFVYHYRLFMEENKRQFAEILEQRFRKLTIQNEREYELTIYNNNNGGNKRSTRSMKKKQRESSVQSISINPSSPFQFPEQNNIIPKPHSKQRFSQNYHIPIPTQKKRLSAMVKSVPRFSITNSLNLQGINQLDEDKEISDVDSQKKNETIFGWETNRNQPKQSEEIIAYESMMKKNFSSEISETIQMSATNSSKIDEKLMSTEIIPKKKNSENQKSKLSSSMTNRSSRVSGSSYNIFGQNYAAINHSETLRKLGMGSSDREIYFQEQNESTSKENEDPYISQVLKQSNKMKQSEQLKKIRHQLVKLTNGRSSAINPDLSQSKNISIIKKQRNSLMPNKNFSSSRLTTTVSRLQKESRSAPKNNPFNRNSVINQVNIGVEEEELKDTKLSRFYHNRESIISKSWNRVSTLPNSFPNFFQSQKKICNSHLDVFRTIQKIIHLLYVHRNELRFSQKTLKQFIEGNLKFLFGANPESQFYYFNKLLSLWKQTSPVIQSFRCMLNFDYPYVYLNDLLKLYVILLDKSGVQNLVVERSKSLKIIEFILSMFYKKQAYDKIIQEIPYLDKSTTNLNEFFLTLNALIKVDTIESQLYCYLKQILPSNEIDLNYSQIQQLTKILNDDIQLYSHLARLKFYCQRDSKSDANIGMKIHKISLYTRLYNWNPFKDIVSTIRSKWEKMNISEESENPYKSKKEIEFMKTLKSSRKMKRFKLQLQNQILHDSECTMLIREECPWLFRLARNQIQNNLKYKTRVNQDFLVHLQIIEYYLQIKKLKVFPQNLESICEITKKVIEKHEWKKIIQNK